LERRGAKQVKSDYSVGEAMAAYIRACNAHGWKVPDSFKEFSAGVVSGITDI
jgi:ubiquitin-conjugating enzyme E2 Q